MNVSVPCIHSLCLSIGMFLANSFHAPNPNDIHTHTHMGRDTKSTSNSTKAEKSTQQHKQFHLRTRHMNPYFTFGVIESLVIQWIPFQLYSDAYSLHRFVLKSMDCHHKHLYRIQCNIFLCCYLILHKQIKWTKQIETGCIMLKRCVVVNRSQIKKNDLILNANRMYMQFNKNDSSFSYWATCQHERNEKRKGIATADAEDIQSKLKVVN